MRVGCEVAVELQMDAIREGHHQVQKVECFFHFSYAERTFFLFSNIQMGLLDVCEAFKNRTSYNYLQKRFQHIKDLCDSVEIDIYNLDALPELKKKYIPVISQQIAGTFFPHYIIKKDNTITSNYELLFEKLPEESLFNYMFPLFASNAVTKKKESLFGYTFLADNDKKNQKPPAYMEIPVFRIFSK